MARGDPGMIFRANRAADSPHRRMSMPGDIGRVFLSLRSVVKLFRLKLLLSTALPLTPKIRWRTPDSTKTTLTLARPAYPEVQRGRSPASSIRPIDPSEVWVILCKPDRKSSQSESAAVASKIGPMQIFLRNFGHGQRPCNSKSRIIMANTAS